MKTIVKTVSVFGVTLLACCAIAWAQSFNVTNTFVMQQEVQVVQSINLGEMVNVVSSAGAPLTNHSYWGTWIPKYIDACIYTNGLDTNNVSDIRVQWTAPQNKKTYQHRYIHQGMPDLWDGIHYIKLPLAKERILAGQRMHVMFLVSDSELVVTNQTSLTNLIELPTGVFVYKTIEIPTSKPDWVVD